jgi:integrase/recombinase XerD
MSQARILNDREYRKVLLHIAKKKHHARNKCLLFMSHLAGLRVGEIASLTLKHVLNGDGSIRDEVYLNADETKGNRGRAVLLPQKLREEMLDYLSVRFKLKAKDLHVLNSTDMTRALFYSQKSHLDGFDANTLSQWFGRIYRESGIEGASSHSGRRFFATHLSENSVNPKIIQKLLGHRQIQTTMLYCEVSPQSMRKAVELLS